MFTHFAIIALAIAGEVWPVVRAGVAGPCGAQSYSYYGRQLHVFGLLGQAKVGDASRNKVTANGIYHSPGVLVDNSAPAGRLFVYVLDSGNSRILGFNVPAPLDTTALLDGSRPADIVIGQPDFASGACNGDDNLGFLKAPSESCLCLMGYPQQTNTAEQWMRMTMDTDAAGNLYVVDVYNNRVLRYNAPLSADKTGGKGDGVADRVWGQPDMRSNGRNLAGHFGGPPAPNDHCLWLDNGDPWFGGVSSRGVSVDASGNVWIADTFNNRVLRFPANGSSADLVIGQPNFTTTGCATSASAMAGLCTPTLARVHPTTGELYVADEFDSPFMARIRVFTPPFTNGMSASRTLAPQQSAPFTNWGAWDGLGTYRFQCTGFVFNTYKQGPYATGEIWLNELGSNRALLVDGAGGIVAVVGAPTPFLQGGDQMYPGECGTNIYDGNHLWSPGGVLGIDRAHNLYLADEFFHTVYRYALPYATHTSGSATCLPDANGVLFPKGPNQQSDDRLGESVGLAVWGAQLLVRDEGMRLKVYDNYAQKPIGAAPDHVLRGGMAGRNWLSAGIDDAGRLWLSGEHEQLRVFQLPIVSNSQQPVADFVPLYWSDTHAQVTVAGGGGYVGVGAVACDTLHRVMYLADAAGTRIFRVHRPALATDSLFVDLVLGQADRNSANCNQGLAAPTAATLCTTTSMKVDRQGNLFVVDNAYECHPNNRMVVFRYADLAAATGLFPNLGAWKVFHAPSLNAAGNCGGIGEPASPVSLAFDSANHLVVGNDGYYADNAQRVYRQLWYYANPLTSQTPDASIALYMGGPGELAFDAQDNLLVQDHTWYRVTMLNLGCDPQWLQSRTADVPIAAKPAGSEVIEFASAAPSPAVSSTVVRYSLARSAETSIAVFDVQGRWVRRLQRSLLQVAGAHRVSWDLRDDHGVRVAPGVYACQVLSGGARRACRLVVVGG